MQRSVGDTTTRERQRRDSVLEDLTRFGLALARASDMGIVRDVVQQALPQFTGGEPEGLEWDGRVYYPLVVGETTTA